MIGIIGCGTMAQAIAKGYYNKNNQVNFLTYTPSYTRAEELAKSINGKAVKNLSDFKDVHTIILACKPQHLKVLTKDLENSQLNLKNKYIISILASTPIDSVKQILGSDTVSRVMPNTPAIIGMGMSLVMHGSGVTAEQKTFVKDFFKACGEVTEIENEKLFDQVTTVSGSGPAYVFLFAETMANKLFSWGLGRDQARKIVSQLFRGSSELMIYQNEKSFEQLISNVTSKSGVTIEAVNSFRNSKIENITSKALDAAYSRSKEIELEQKST